ncbi:MAG TPA: S9 family peptidase [Steroidobacteraceae bacterium]|nr:S9 family peptidase [Steroidobacteraceae bacterium]
MKRLVTVAGALLVSTIAFSQQPEILERQVGTATLQNVPEIPESISAAVEQYQNYRAAELEGWLADGSILIATRFGTTQQIHRVARPGAARTQLTFFPEPVGEAIPIPGSNRFIASVDTGGDELCQLFLAGEGAPTLLTEPGTRNESAVMSRHGTWVAWARAVEDSAEYTILIADPADPDSVRPVHRDDVALEVADVAPDGHTLLFLRRFSNRESELHVLDLRSGDTRRLAPVDGQALYLDPYFTPDGRSVVAISNHDSDFRRLIEIDVATGEYTVLTPELGWDVEDSELSPGGRVLAYSVNEAGYSRIVLEDRIARRGLPQPTLPRGVLTRMKFSPDGAHLAVSLSTPTIPGDVWSWDIAAGSLTRWTDSELGGLEPADLVEPELVRFESFDGLEIQAFVYRPKGVPADEPVPVIVDIHGGPESQSRPEFNPGVQYFADVLGAAVILPNVRGSEGYGQRFLDLDNAAKREDSVRDIGALLDWIATQPDLDADRVAVYGQSYGGYMSLASMIHYGDRLVGGVERYGISDFATFLQNTEDYRRDLRRAEYGDERDPQMREVFARISPLANVAKIEKPMLVMQGANDPRVPQSESDQIVAGIRANDVEVWYVLFADEGHGFLKKHNNDLRRAVETIFLERLFEPTEDLNEED